MLSPLGAWLRRANYLQALDFYLPAMANDRRCFCGSFPMVARRRSVVLVRQTPGRIGAGEIIDSIRNTSRQMNSEQVVYGEADHGRNHLGFDFRPSKISRCC